MHGHEVVAASGRQHTITINDTPSPAVSVITISDSEDEGTTGKKSNANRTAPQTNPQSVHRKNVISCVSVADSDTEDHRSPAKVQ